MAIENKTADQPARRPDMDVFLDGRPDLAGEGVRDALAKIASAVKAALPQLREGRTMTVRLPERPEQVRVAMTAYAASLATRLNVSIVCGERQAKPKPKVLPGESLEDAMARMLAEDDEPDEQAVEPEARNPMAATLPETGALGQTLSDQPVPKSTSDAAADILRKYQRRPRS